MIQTQDFSQISSYPIHKLKIFKIQRTCVYDGPGVRTTLFFRGCNLKCLWCANPEGQSFQQSLDTDCNYSLEEIMSIILKDSAYYQSTYGGVTLSGGEPFLQDTLSLIHLLELLKNAHIPVSVETTLFAPWDNIRKLVPYIDLFLVDLKVVGDDALHTQITKHDSKMIQQNIQELLKMDAKIRFRMVIVPNYNDGEQNIKAAADFLKSIHYDTIELLKYHNMYEEKAKRLGLEYNVLNISSEQSITTLKKSAELFKKFEINAESPDLKAPPPRAIFTQRVLDIQNAIREAPRGICIESAKLKTEYYKKNGFDKPTHIHRAERLVHLFKNKKVIIYPQELLIGNFTAKRVGGQLWEEYYGTLAITYYHRLSQQKPVKFELSFKDKMNFYFNIFPFWKKHSLISKVFPKLSGVIRMLAHGAQVQAGFLNNMAAIAHYIVNFERILTLGTTGIIAEIKKTQKEKPENNQDFYNAAIITLEGFEIFAQRYAEELSNLAKQEGDLVRKKELEEMAQICANVPKYPARTYHEALQCMVFVQIALCLEAYENAISFGRLDQILFPYFKRDLDAGIITYEKAKELLCLFVLKMDEAILVNDGDSMLALSKLFETLSTDQAVTFGGVGKDGRDATNDITYMLMDTCELQPLAINMCARIHKTSPQKYLERLAELYINGVPMPELFSDEIYIDSIMRHYNTTLEYARNYSIVGCVEPVASDNHFGNTDCANMNLATVLVQAMRGLKYDLWNVPPAQQREKLITNYIEWTFNGKSKLARFHVENRHKKIKRREIKRGHYLNNPPATMDELLERFQARLNELADSILHDHQYIEKKLGESFTTPFCSSLYTACVQNGKDVYEGGTTFNSSGIQAVGVTDVADSLFALNELVFKKKQYSVVEILDAMDHNFQGKKYAQIRDALMKIPKFGDDASQEAVNWVSKVMQMYNLALASVKHETRNAVYSAGYYALNVADQYGKHTSALPSGRLYGVPLANSVTPHYGMEHSDLLSSLNSIAGVNFTDFAVNGTTVTFTIDAALFQGVEGVKNLAAIFKTFLTTGGMQFQPNVINREILMDAYNHPDKYKYLMVRVAGYCAYFNELSDELKLIIINRTCYS